LSNWRVDESMIAGMSENQDQIKNYDEDYKQDIEEFKSVVEECNKQNRNINSEDTHSFTILFSNELIKKRLIKKSVLRWKNMLQRLLK